MPNARLSTPSRRGILAAGGALGLGAALAACGSDSKDSGSGAKSGSAKSGPWSFKDDRGTTAKADKVPANVVAFTSVAAALWDYGIECKGVFGPTKTSDGKADVQAGDIDVDKVTIIGNEWGRFNIEKYATLSPDLLVTTVYDTAGTLWSVPLESKD
ncbi:ABC transporter substrate-binding protein, partial [Streptomyces sp. NPDC058320]